jgi:hypothetical protein
MAKVNKLTPYKDGKKRKMVMTKLTAVALTARGANPEAHVTFFKSHKGGESSVEKRTVLATMEALHTHAVVIDDYAKLNKGGSTSWAGGEGNQHSHDYVIEDDGSVTIGANEGHLHFVEKNVEQITKSGLSDEQIADLGLVVNFQKDELAANTGGQQSANEDSTMTDAEKAAKKAADELTLLKNQLALAILMGSMNDAQKAHHASLDEKGQTEFLEKSVEDREAIVTAAAKAAAEDNAVIYKSAKGVEFFKNDDPRLVEMAKDGDVQAAQLAKSAETVANAEVAKRATEVFKHMSGTASAQTALLKSVDGIEDETVRKEVMEILAKSDAGIAALTTEHGSAHTDVTKGDAAAAHAKLEGLAKKHVVDNPGTNAFDAYVLMGEQNPELYTQAVG